MKSVAIVMTLLCVFCASCNKNPKKPGLEIPALSDMVYPVPIEAYRAPMRLPVAGTVSRQPLWVSPDGKSNPISYTAANMLRGQFVYENYCLICHGKSGDGDGPLVPKFPNPPSLTSRRVMALSSAELFDVVTEGKRDMAAYAAQISTEDRWKVVLYLEKLQGKSPQGGGS